MKKFTLSLAFVALFAASSAQAYSVSIDQVKHSSCGSVTISGSAEFTEGQQAPNGTLSIYKNGTLVSTIDGRPSKWSVSIPNVADQSFIEAQMSLTDTGSSNKIASAGTYVSVPVCDNTPVALDQTPSTPAPKPVEKLLDRNLIEQFIRFLQAVLAQ